MWGWLVATVAALCIRRLVLYLMGSFKEGHLAGRTVLVTGGNGGLGYEVVSRLLAAGASVLVASKRSLKTDKALALLRARHPNSSLVWVELDLARPSSVQSCAEEVKSLTRRLDVLINNAGVATAEYHKTEEGFEQHMAVNHLGHLLLTNLLLDKLKQSAPSRIVNVSSVLFLKGVVELEALEQGGPGPTGFLGGGHAAYANSKMAGVMAARHMARLLDGSGVTVYSVCPGFCFTTLIKQYHFTWYEALFCLLGAIFYLKSTDKGVDCILKCALDEELAGESGQFYINCGRSLLSGWRTDPVREQRLWETSLRLVGLTPATEKHD